MLGQAFGFEGFLKLGAAANVTVTLIDSTDHVTGKTGLTLTIWATKAAGTPASISPTVTELDSTNVKGVYKLALTAAMVDTLGEFQLHITATGADPADLKWEVSTYLPGEAAILQADQAVNVTKVAGDNANGARFGRQPGRHGFKSNGDLYATGGIPGRNVPDRHDREHDQHYRRRGYDFDVAGDSEQLVNRRGRRGRRA